MSDPTVPTIYHDAKKGSFWLLNKRDGRWLNLEKRDVKMHYQMHGFPVDEYCSNGMKAFDRAVVVCQQTSSIDYAGPLAGYGAGLLKTQDGKKVLVTSEARPIQPKKGNCAKFEQFIGELLGSDQGEFFLLWLKLSLESLREEQFRPGQMVALAGPSGCGKSLLQALITVILGGRMAKPYGFMTQQTAFNSHLAAAEHLVIADEQASLDLRSRRAFGAAIKDFTVNREMQIHAKGRDITVTVPTFRRLTLSVNDEPENLAILPPMDESILDKIALLKCSKANVGQKPKEIWARFEPELPAVVYELGQMRVPRNLHDERYGVRAYHNPELLNVVAELSPEARLLQLIDQVLFAKADGEDHKRFVQRTAEPWKGTAIELEKDLRNSPFPFVVDKLLTYGSACGSYLARLRTKHPDRFQANASKGKTVWTITKAED